MKSRLLSVFSFVILLIFSAVLYVGTVRGVQGNIDEVSGQKYQSVGMPFESSHERAPYALVLALDRYKQIHLTKELAEFASPDVGVYQDKFFILFPPGVSFLLYPFYLLGKPFQLAQIFSYASVSLFGLGTIGLLFLLCRQMFSLPRWISVLVPIVYAFATTSWSFTVTIYQHAQTTFFLALALYAAYKYKHSRKGGVVWTSIIWFCYGIGVFIDFPSVFLGLPILIYATLTSLTVKSEKKQYTINFRPAMVLGSFFFVLLLILHGVYNQAAFGDWKKFGQSFSRYEGEEKYELRMAKREAEATLSGTLIKPSSRGSNPFSVFDEDRIVRGLETLTIAEDKGLFYFSPVLLLGVLAWFLKNKQEKLEQGILVSIALVNILMYASFGDPWGGWAYGPRYLLPAMMVLSLFTGIFLYRFSVGWIAKLLFVPLFIYSVGISVLGVITTNIIPPKVEGIPLGIQYGYIANIFYFFEGVTGSYVYLLWLRNLLTLQQYAAVIFFAIVLFGLLLLGIGVISGKPYTNLLLFSNKTKKTLQRVISRKRGAGL